MSTSAEQIKKFLENGAIKEAIDSILLLFEDNTDFQDMVRIISGDYHEMRNSEIRGDLTKEEITVKKREISKRLLDALSMYEPKPYDDEAEEIIKKSTVERHLKRAKYYEAFYLKRAGIVFAVGIIVILTGLFKGNEVDERFVIVGGSVCAGAGYLVYRYLKEHDRCKGYESLIDQISDKGYFKKPGAAWEIYKTLIEIKSI